MVTIVVNGGIDIDKDSTNYSCKNMLRMTVQLFAMFGIFVGGEVNVAY
jgi:hypothetical protein